MFQTVKEKIDGLLATGYSSRYANSQLIWERLRTDEKVLLKKEENGELTAQVLAIPDKLGVYFQDIPLKDDYCRFHEGEIG